MIIPMPAKYLIEYAAIFLLLLIVAYLIPAGIFYWLFFVRRNESTEAMRIQERRHGCGRSARSKGFADFAFVIFILQPASLSTS